MRYIRPVWLTHSGEKKDFEVYSCHVSPDGSRLVTAAGDGYVRVWSVEAVFNAADPTFNGPKQLASMSYHSGTIHTVRFSGNGRYLASGADDKIVCVYTLDPHPPSHNATFGTDEPPPVETWKIHRRLIGHDNDVQDLGWSYDSSILVSVGLDSKVVIWSGYTFEKLKTISGHQSLVKGITFDPANKYFATASDDRTVKLWRFTSPGPNSTAYDQISNFILEETITAPFLSSPLTTYFRRCSWSPDGAHIAAANAVNGPVSSVAIINRGSWDCDIHLIGHEGPVEVCAFSPRLFSKIRPSDQSLDPQSKGQNIANLVTVVACAGQDKALTVWITSNSRPLVITQDLALKSLSDLAWTPDGTNLFITSLDGSIICVAFDPGELGYEVSLEETEKALEKFGAGRRGAGIIEGTDGLLLEERSREGELRDAEGRMGALMGDAPASQVVTLNGNEMPAPTSIAAVNGSPPTTDARPGHVNGVSQRGPDEDQPEKGQAPEDAHKEKLEKLKSRVTITKDGKKRIAPLLLSSSGGHESSLPRAQLISASKNAQGGRGDAPQTILDLSKPFDGLPKGGLASLLFGNKRKWAQVEGAEDDQSEKRVALTRSEGAVPILMNTADGLVPAQPGSGMVGQQPTPDFIRPAVLNPSMLVSQVRLAIPKIRRHVVQTYGEASGLPSLASEGNGPKDGHPGGNRQAQSDITIEARNPSQLPSTGKAPDQEPCRVTVSRRGQPLWQDFLPRSTLLVTGNRLFWAAACEDGSIHAWTPAGRRLVNALILESQPVIMECKNKWLLCVTAVGMCHVWDMKTLSSPHPPVSLAPVLDIAIHSLQDHVTHGPAVTSAHLNSEGRIVVSLSNGDGFAYSPSMYVWQRLTELWWAVGSQYWNTTDSSLGDVRSSSSTKSASNISAGIIPFLERGTTSESMVRGKSVLLQRLVKQLLSREGYEGFESSVSLAHLENRMAGAMMLGSKEEFQVYLYMYAKRLGAEGLKSKVEELLRGLLGGVGEEHEGDAGIETTVQRNAEDRNWDNATDLLCGWSRKELLKGVILILGKNRDLQRITVPYANIIGVTGEQETDGNTMVS
ncbi:HIR complex subunit [Xanthoria parietina]